MALRQQPEALRLSAPQEKNPQSPIHPNPRSPMVGAGPEEDGGPISSSGAGHGRPPDGTDRSRDGAAAAGRGRGAPATGTSGAGRGRGNGLLLGILGASPNSTTPPSTGSSSNRTGAVKKCFKNLGKNLCHFIRCVCYEVIILKLLLT
jgi:hypothetical protein